MPALVSILNTLGNGAVPIVHKFAELSADTVLPGCTISTQLLPLAITVFTRQLVDAKVEPVGSAGEKLVRLGVCEMVMLAPELWVKKIARACPPAASANDGGVVVTAPITQRGLPEDGCLCITSNHLHIRWRTRLRQRRRAIIVNDR